MVTVLGALTCLFQNVVFFPFRGLFAMAASPSLASAERLTIIATTGMIADAAEQVGGDLVTVKSLMGPGIDPHAYRQTRSDIVAHGASRSRSLERALS